MLEQEHHDERSSSRCAACRVAGERRRPVAAGEPHDPLPVVRLFTPDAHAIWLLAALDPADGDTAFGVIDLGIGMPELGHIKLSDLASIVGPNKQPVMRDRYFQAARPLSEYLRLARETVPSSIERSRCGQTGRIQTISVLLQACPV